MITRLINERLSHRRSISHLETSADGLGADVSLSAAEMILDLLVDCWSKFQTVQLAIEERMKYENMENEIEFMESTDASHFRTRSKLTAIAVSMKVKQNLKDEFGAIVRLHVRLPKQEVPKFDGSFINWSSFRDVFSSIVGNNDTISDGERLQCSQALKALSDPIDSLHWLLIQLVGVRFDSKALLGVDSQVEREREMPSWQQMVAALEIRCSALESEQDKFQFLFTFQC